MTADYEARCCHEECTEAFTKEIKRIGFQAAEDLCLERERQDDEAYYGALFHADSTEER